MLDSMKEKLVVVFDDKDEVAFNYLKKLVETEDDENGNIVGTEDNTVAVLAWDKKKFKDNKNMANKVMFLGDVKEASNITPIMDVIYNELGITYGISGKNAVIQVNENGIRNDEDLKQLITKYETIVKKIKADESASNNAIRLRTKSKVSIIIAAATMLVDPIGGGALVANSVMCNLKKYRENGQLRKTMFLYGITKFYLEELDSFMKK